MNIYINGVDLGGRRIIKKHPSGIADSPMNLSIGAGYSSSTVPNTEFFNGSISELRIYNHSLSEQQVKALYNNQTDMIVSQETEMYEVWQACITPNDGTVNGETKCSNNLTISKCPGELGNWVMNDDYTLEHNITCESILINNSATLTVTNKRTITTKNLTVMADSQINSDEQGYSGGGYRADGEGPGGGDFSSPAAGGGSYGGESGRGGSGGSLRGSKSQPYGSMWRPDDYGSGGAGGYDANRPGGDGGGLIQLEISDIFILNGTISADGGNGTSGSNPGAGGAGGGIYINASTLKGDGRLHADGGGGRNDGDDEDSGGGSGGRIAVYFTEDSFSGMAQSNAHAGLKEGTSGEDGEPGTVVFVDIDDNKLWASSKVEFNGTDFFSAGTFKETAESQFNFSEAHFMTSSMYVSSELNITLDLLNMSAVTSFTCDSYSGTENFGFAINYSSSRIFDISTTVFNVSTISLNPSLSFSSCNRINVFENTSSSAFFDNKSISFDNDLLVSNPEGESINNASIYVTNDMNISNMTLNLKLLISNITVNENLRIPQFESLKMINSSLNREIHTSSLILYVEKNISLFNSTLYGNYRINTTNLTIDSSSKIAADTRGYSGGSSSSDGSGPAGGDSASTYSACGASHGGRGGRGTYNGAYYCVQKDPVGSALAPNDYGSGGAGGNGGVGGDGGGLLWLEVGDTLVLDGSITSHGEDGFGTSNPGAGGAGGSIYVNASRLTGSGFFAADGGNGPNEADDEDPGGAGGGRIAVYFRESELEDMTVSHATKGLSEGSSEDGENGTLVFIDVDDNTAWILTRMEFNASDTAHEGILKSSASDEFNFSMIHILSDTIRIDSNANITADTLNMSLVDKFICDSDEGTDYFGFKLNTPEKSIYPRSTAVFNVTNLFIKTDLEFSNCDLVNLYENLTNSFFFENRSITTNNALYLDNPTLEVLLNPVITTGHSLEINASSLGNLTNMTGSIGYDLIFSGLKDNCRMTDSKFTTTNRMLSMPITSLFLSNTELTSTANANASIMAFSDNLTLSNSNITASIKINATNLTIPSDSFISASECGYAGGGYRADGEGPGGGDLANTYSACGGSYGGVGARGTYNGAYYCVVKPTYGSALRPDNYGSGGAGGGTGYPGGDGGGLIQLEVLDTLFMDSTIEADGQAATG
jgi:hypothetical protein